MARKRKQRRSLKTLRGLRGVKCKRTRLKAQTRTVCRNAKGQIVGSFKGKRKVLKAVCPKKWKGKKVHQAAGGGCYVKTRGKGARFVPKRRAA